MAKKPNKKAGRFVILASYGESMGGTFTSEAAALKEIKAYLADGDDGPFTVAQEITRVERATKDIPLIITPLS